MSAMIKKDRTSLPLAWLMLAATGLCAADQALPRIKIAKDGRTFETEAGRPFVPFGVSYFRPNTGWAP
jgi:hypothetical protein